MATIDLGKNVKCVDCDYYPYSRFLIYVGSEAERLLSDVLHYNLRGKQCNNKANDL